MPKRKIIILAAHDDGVGAHTSICRVRDGILEALKANKKADEYFFLYLNKGAVPYKDLHAYWNLENEERWEFSNAPSIDPSGFSEYSGIWLETDNYIKFAKNPIDGTLDAPGTRELIKKIRSKKHWGHNLEDLDTKTVAFTVEMGVPYLSEWASEKNIPGIAVTDMLWSRTLMGSLKGAGEYDHETESFVHELIEKERKIKEAWLIPLLAPRNYTDFLAEMQVIYHWLPGFLGKRPVQAEIVKARHDLHIASDEKLIIMVAGKTVVWEEKYKNIANEFLISKASSNIAFAYPHENKLVIINKGRTRQIDNPPSLLATYAAADLGVTRGGVTITEFIAANLPFVVIQEPNHWLSQKQQAAASEEGLCHTAGLSRFTDANQAVNLLEKWVNEVPNNKLMKDRYMMYDFGVESKLGDHLVRRFCL